MRRLAGVVGALALALGGAACGGGNEDEPLTVFAAASLTEVFEELDPDARYNFAGSDELAAQLREGAAADVYAAASPTYPEELFADGLLERPVVFATNRLVVIAPSNSRRPLRSLADVGRPGTKVVIGDEGVPIGDYTREVLRRARRASVLRRVVSEEQDVKGIVGKVGLGEADAAFVYATDARAAGDDVRVLELPAAVQADARYPVAVVRGSQHPREARAFVRLLLGERGRRVLRQAGFGLP